MLIGGLEMGAYNPKDAIVIEGFQFDDFNSLFDYLKKVMSQGIKEFEELFAKNPIEDWKFDYSDRMRFESHITDYLTI